MRFPLAAVGLAAAMTFQGLAPAHAESFDTGQQQEIRDIVRAYLLEHPEVIVEAIQVLQDRQDAAEAEHAKGQIAELRDKLLRDARDPVIGNPVGDVTLVEFFDYRCGYCKQAQPIVMELIKADPKVRVVLKEFPILGPDSVLASHAALAAVGQDKYRELHEALIASRGALPEDKIMAIAKSVGLDTDRLKQDMAAPAIAGHIDDVKTLAQDLGINGTPGFIIGDTLVPGVVDLATLQKLVDEARKTCTNAC